MAGRHRLVNVWETLFIFYLRLLEDCQTTTVQQLTLTSLVSREDARQTSKQCD